MLFTILVIILIFSTLAPFPLYNLITKGGFILKEQFIDYVKKMQNYAEALSVIYWDMRTGAPKKGLSQRAEVIGTLSAELFALQTSEELGHLLAQLEHEELDFVTRRLYEEVKKEYDESKKIPADEFKAYTILKAK